MSKRKKKIPQVGHAVVKRTIFIRGKQKTIREDYIDGLPMQEWLDINQDPISMMQNGEYEKLGDYYTSYAPMGNLPSAPKMTKPVDVNLSDYEPPF